MKEPNILLGKGVPFYKMHGCGNDFIFVDNRPLGIEPARMVQWAKELCRKSFGIHADGMVFLSDSPAGSGLDYVWNFINKDGSYGEMCGNAARCAAMLAHALGMAPAEHTFGTLAGPIKAVVIESTGPSGIVNVQLPNPEGLELNLSLDAMELEDQPVMAHYVVVGVPHTVIFVQDPDKVDVTATGRAIRQHCRFSPKGTNVNFVQVVDHQTLAIRTYERGVEDETFACGTGAASSQVIAHALGSTLARATVKTLAGFELDVEIRDEVIFQQGPAQVVFKGEFYPPA